MSVWLYFHCFILLYLTTDEDNKIKLNVKYPINYNLLNHLLLTIIYSFLLFYSSFESITTNELSVKTVITPQSH